MSLHNGRYIARAAPNLFALSMTFVDYAYGSAATVTSRLKSRLLKIDSQHIFRKSLTRTSSPHTIFRSAVNSSLIQQRKVSTSICAKIASNSNIRLSHSQVINRLLPPFFPINRHARIQPPRLASHHLRHPHPPTTSNPRNSNLPDGKAANPSSAHQVKGSSQSGISEAV